MIQLRLKLKTMLASVLLGVGVAGACGWITTEPGLEDVIGDQQGTHRFVLGNGLEVVVVRSVSVEHADVQAWLIVRAGSMYEGDDQRGSAKIYERLIRSGTQSYSQEHICNLLGAQGGLVGGRSGSFVSFDHAAYMAQVDLANLEQLNEVFGFYREILDVDASGFILSRFEQAVGELVGEINGQQNAELRSRQQWLPELMSGTLFGDRLPVPELKALESLEASTVSDFAQTWYRPGQATVLVLGDVDAGMIESMAVSTLGGLKRGEPCDQFDGRLKCDVSMRSASGSDEDFETHQAAMVWFDDRGDDSVGRWSDRAQEYRFGDMREVVIHRIAGEIVRHRLARLSTQELGGLSEVGVDQFELFGQIDVVQIGVDTERSLGNSGAESWDQAMVFLVNECDRMSRDGVVGEELARARRSVLARWHRESDDWGGLSNKRRMGLMHWQLTTGRPMMDMVRWDGLATDMMSGIRDDEINRALQEMINPIRASYVALVSSADDDGLDAQTVMGVVERAMGSPIGRIDPSWMGELGGSLIDSELSGGEMVELSGHDRAGVLSVVLDNQVRVYTRAMFDTDPENDTRVFLSATLWGGSIASGAIDEDRLDAAMNAWRAPATEARGRGAVSSYMTEHDLEIHVERQVGFVQIKIDGPSRSVEQIMELAFVLLDRPMIESGVFESWKKRYAFGKRDPLDEAIEALYPLQSAELGRRGTVDLEGAQRLLTQIVRNSRLDIGIAGAIDVDTVIEEAGRIFGSLVSRDGGLVIPVDDDQHDKVKDGFLCEQLVRVESIDEDEIGVVLGYVGKRDQELDELRSLILTSMVLNDQLANTVHEAAFGGVVRSTVAYTDATPGQMVFFIRAYCSKDKVDEAREIIRVTLDRMVGRGIDEQTLAKKQQILIRSISRYFDTPKYWSQRLGMLRSQGRSVEELWTIRSGYQSIKAGFASEVFKSMLVSEQQFEIEIVEAE